jgi:REP element-mobilizing transposase RayT
MSSTFSSLRYHIVFSTKERRPLIHASWRDRLHAYLGGIVRNLGGVAEAVGGVEDHVHLLLNLKTTHCIADLMREVKKDSSAWANENFGRHFGWQEGYSAFTVSQTHAKAVREYIGTQEQHHRKADFRSELKTLLEKNGVSYDPKFLP